jgi:hypothetical protein
MQEFDSGGLLTATPESEIVAKQQQEYRMIGRMPVKPGHTLFSVNTATLEVLPVKIIKHIAMNLDGKPVKVQKTNFDPKLYYTSALNKENALKHYKKAVTIYLQNLKKSHKL